LAETRIRVACLGASSTAGKGQAFDWIGELRGRPRNAHVRFVNLGVGGDFAGDALRRVPQVLACRPDQIIVWVGGNDVLAALSRHFYRAARFLLRKSVPRPPSPEAYRDALQATARALRSGSAARLALCSLSPIGEAPNATQSFQAALNRRVAEYSGIVAAIARAEDAAYIPIYEALSVQIRKAPGRAFTGFRFFPFYRDAFRTMVLRESVDTIGRRNGWRFHSDGMHLNSRGGMIVADLVQEFIDGR
jgi:lysophospholipase L1-like esterase